MNKRLTRIIDSYESSFELSAGVISITLRSHEEYNILYANFNQQNLPESLKNIINTPQQLFIALINIDRENVRIHNNEIVLQASLFTLKREFVVPLDSTNLSDEDSFIHQNQIVKKEMQKSHFDSIFTQKKPFIHVSSAQHSQNRSQVMKEAMLSQLNYSFMQDNHSLVEENETLNRQNSEILTQNRILNTRNIRLQEEKQDLVASNELLFKEKHRLAKFFEQSSQEKEEKKDQTQKEDLRSKNRDSSRVVELIEEQAQQMKELAVIFNEKAQAVQYKLEIAKEVKELRNEVTKLEQEKEDLTVKRDSLNKILEK